MAAAERVRAAEAAVDGRAVAREEAHGLYAWRPPERPPVGAGFRGRFAPAGNVAPQAGLDRAGRTLSGTSGSERSALDLGLGDRAVDGVVPLRALSSRAVREDV